MMREWNRISLLLTMGALFAGGCATTNGPDSHLAPKDMPRELTKVSHPTYRVEPPDILYIEAFKGVPRGPYKIEPLDVLFVQMANSLPTEPLQGNITVDTEGMINLGSSYGGTVKIVGMTLAEAKKAVEKHLSGKFKDPDVTVSLAQTRAPQRVSGPHLVRQDGTVGLGVYGSVYVTGLTIAETKRAIEAHLSQYLQDPEVSVEVQGFNSKTYYVVTDFGGAGQQVLRFPITGNETVLDAISQVNGLSTVSSTDRIWVTRPAPAGSCPQILPVDWNAVVYMGETTTNYQIMPGDRVFIAAQPLIKLDTALARIISPMERVLGFTLLGNSVVRNVSNPSATGSAP